MQENYFMGWDGLFYWGLIVFLVFFFVHCGDIYVGVEWKFVLTGFDVDFVWNC